MSQGAGEAALCAVLGITSDELRFYRVVLRHSGAAEEALHELLGIRPGDFSDCLKKLEAAGLVRSTRGAVSAIPPEEVVGSLIATETRRLSETQERVEGLRAELPALVSLYRSQPGEGADPVDVYAVEGGDVSQLIQGLARGSTGDLLWLRPDQWRVPVSASIDQVVSELLAEGRRSRAIYPARILEEAPDVVFTRAEAGEQIRIAASVPCRMGIMGWDAALLPERWGENTGRRLVVREHALVGAVIALFEAMWERAMVVPGLGEETPGGAPGSDRRLLLDQLASGAKDEQIARNLGLSLRTVRRRVADVLLELGVESRFQAGVEAVRRGWL